MFTELTQKITERIRFLRSFSLNHWRYLLRNLTHRELNLILAALGLAASSAFYLSAYDYWTLREPAPARGGSYAEGIVGEPRYVNPVLASANEVDRDISTLVFSGLVKHDESGRIVPDLAEKYEIKDNGKTYEFTLRPGLEWPDKKPFTADDVIFTINLIKDARFQSPLRNNWLGVRVEKIDDARFAMKLPAAYEPFLENAAVGILPSHLWSNIQPQNFLLTQLNLKPVGLGQYQLTKITKNGSGEVRSMEFSPNPRYYEKANIARLILRFYENQDSAVAAYKRREIDGLSLSSPLENEDIKSRSAVFHQIKLPRYFAVFFNTDSTILKETEVRRALAYAADRETILKEALKSGSQIQQGPFPFNLLGLGDPQTVYEFDLEKARGILDKANWKLAEDGVRQKRIAGKTVKLELTLTTTEWPELTRTAAIIQKNWRDIGVKVNLDIVPVNAIQNQTIRPRQYQALLFGEVLNLNPDPFSFWHSTQRKDPGLNLALYSNKKVDGMLETARRENDTEKRAKIYREFQEVLMKDVPAVFLYSPNYAYAVSGKVKGIDVEAVNTPSQRLENINKWYIATKRTKIKN